MTKVLLQYGAPAPDGTYPPVEGILIWTPTRRRVITGMPDKIIMPIGFKVPITGGVITVNVAPSGIDWVWRVDELVKGASRVISYRAVPDVEEIDFTDLVGIDPTTLQPMAEPEPIWYSWAEGLALAAGNAEQSAEDSKLAAIDSQTSALASATAAKASEDQAAAYVLQAGGHAHYAGDAAFGAGDSMFKAKASEDAAKASEDAAEAAKADAFLFKQAAETAKVYSEAARDEALAAEALTVSSGNVDGNGHLILTRNDETTHDAGQVAVGLSVVDTTTGFSSARASDADVKDLILDTASGTRMLLDATFGKAIDARDSFKIKPNGALISGAVTDSGHVYTIAKNVTSTGYKIVNGYLMHDQGTTTATTADYAGIKLPSKVGRIWADFRYPASAIPQSENLTLIVSDALFAKTTPGDSFANAAAHFNITRAGWSYEILQKTPFTITQLASGTFATPLAFDTDYQVAVEYSGTTATIYLPDGSIKTATHVNIDAWRGQHATIEHYAFDGSARSLLAVKGWGADVEKSDLSRSLTMARVQASMLPKALSYRPATQADYTATATLSDVDATNAAITFVAPSTGKVVVRVQGWLDTNATGDTLWALSHNGTGGFGGGAQRVRSTTAAKERVALEWVVDSLTPYQTVTAKLQHMVTSAGSSILRAGAGNGYYLTMTVAPVQ